MCLKVYCQLVFQLRCFCGSHCTVVISYLETQETKLLMHISSILQWLCLQLIKETTVGPASPIQQQWQKACSVANNIAVWCRAKSLDELAAVFVAYTHREIKSINNFLACVSPLLCNEWFPKHSALAFGHLLCLLEKGPIEYQSSNFAYAQGTGSAHSHGCFTKPPYVFNCIPAGGEYFMLGGIERARSPFAEL